MAANYVHIFFIKDDFRLSFEMCLTIIFVLSIFLCCSTLLKKLLFFLRYSRINSRFSCKYSLFRLVFLVKLSVANACRTATRIAIGLFWPHWRLRMMKDWRWRLMIEAVLSNHVLDDLGHWRWHIGRHSVRIRLQIGVYVIRRVNFSLDTFRAPISQGHVGKYDLAILNFC